MAASSPHARYKKEGVGARLGGCGGGTGLYSSCYARGGWSVSLCGVCVVYVWRLELGWRVSLCGVCVVYVWYLCRDSCMCNYLE